MSDNVNSPAHYTSGKIEAIDSIESSLSHEEFKGYCKGNILKYGLRAGKKIYVVKEKDGEIDYEESKRLSEIEDIGKVRKYGAMLITHLENNEKETD